MTTCLFIDNALHTWAESMAMHAHIARMDAEDRAYRARLTPAQLREYRLFNGEIAEVCPACGTRDAGLEHEEMPDMVGTTYWSRYTCCGHTGDSFNSALEYRDGVAVDVR